MDDDTDLQMFIPMTKIDVAQRLVFGVMAAEEPDRSREIMDWATGKPAIQKWSDGISASTGGASLGNVRLMHGKTAVGKLTKMDFVDDTKRVEVCAKIIDDAAWNLVEERVLTGFSMGGGYAKRWPDPANPLLKRYTPAVAEVSLVDSPCIPGAVIVDLLKADGTTERVRMVGRWDPTNDEVKDLAQQLAKAAGKPGRRADFVVRARADLIKAHAEAEEQPEALTEAEVLVLLKAAHPGVTDEAVLAKAAAGILIQVPPTDEAVDALVKAWVPPAAEAEAPKPEDRLTEALAKAAQVQADATTETAAPEGPWTDLRKAAEAYQAIMAGALDKRVLVKGLWDVKWMADLMGCWQDLQSCMASEANWEGDGSALPAKAKEILTAMGALLVAYVSEEVAEVVSGAPDTVVVVPVEMALATQIVDLVKADQDVMEKAGKRNSAADQDKLNAIHDHSVAMGADCGAADKMAKLAGTEEDLAKARATIEAALPQIETLAQTVAAQGELIKTQGAELTKLGQRAAPGKGVILAVPRERDGGAGHLIGEGDKEALTKDSGGAPLDPVARQVWARAQLAGAGFPAPGG